jgi:hypothetical protein
MDSATPEVLIDAPGHRGRLARGFAALGIRGENPAHTSAVGQTAFNWIRVVFGLALLYNTWTSLSWQHKTAAAQALGLPTSSPVLHLLVIVLVFVQLAVAMSVLFNRGVTPMSWIGILHSLYIWVIFQHGGDFGQDGTDPGVSMAYVVMFLFLIAGDQHRTNQDLSKNPYMTLARTVFGLLWAYDAMMKFHPYFMNHFVDFLTSAETTMKGTWGAGYDHLFVILTNAIGPHLVPVLVALTESAVALSLISGRGLRILAPVGFVLSLVIWSTAETWGGPYPLGVSTSGGQMFGNAIIYTMAFCYILTLYNPLDLLRGRR